jgi:hypothetical protein
MRTCLRAIGTAAAVLLLLTAAVARPAAASTGSAGPTGTATATSKHVIVCEITAHTPYTTRVGVQGASYWDCTDRPDILVACAVVQWQLLGEWYNAGTTICTDTAAAAEGQLLPQASCAAGRYYRTYAAYQMFHETWDDDEVISPPRLISGC